MTVSHSPCCTTTTARPPDHSVPLWSTTMQCSRSVLIVGSLLSLLALLACSLVFYTHSSELCPEGAFPCRNSSLCIPQHLFCNGHVDCPMADDEGTLVCADSFGHDEFMDKFTHPKRITLSSDCKLELYPAECDCGEETAIWCKDRGLTAVPQNVSENVKKMILANNSISLTEDSFSKFCCITVIHLEGNHLKTIPEKVFHNQSALSRLLLQRNELEYLPAGLFFGLRRLQWLFLHHNKLKFLNMQTWGDMTNLLWLELMNNKITLEHESFPYLPSLEMLNLAHNNIQIIRNATFSHLYELSELDLQYNLVQYIQEDSFHKLRKLNYLDLSHNSLYILDEKVFCYLHSLVKLILGHNPLQEVPRKLFNPLGNLSSLDLQEIEIEHIDTTMFQMMGKLDFVYFKQYYYCSYAPKVPKCSPISDGLSSFENLLSRPIQRITVWLVATFTCVANMLVVLGRFTARDENQALSFVVRNLAVSDLLMGVYLVMIAYKDLSYRGNYNNHAHEWMSSIACTVSGVTAMVSSEVSVLILAFLSLERFLLIAVPFSGYQKLNLSTAIYSLTTIWVVGFIVAVAPVLHWKDTTRFYGTNGMCFPLHIDIPFLMGWQYSAFIFLGVNTTVMVLMGVVYSAMFHSIVKTRTATTISLGDSEFAVRFFLIVLTDSLCWAPITIIKILALCRVPIPGSLYAWMVVFVLPVNSAINPLLYTFTTPKYCKIIKDLGGIITRRNLYNSKKHLSADTESSLVSNKHNVCLAPMERKSERKGSDSVSKQLQPSKLETFAEETL